jgi:hypothetical protein
VSVGLVGVGGAVSYSVDVLVAVVPEPAVPGSLPYPVHNVAMSNHNFKLPLGVNKKMYILKQFSYC